jgi:uncharacterized membrane protein YkoI
VSNHIGFKACVLFATMVVAASLLSQEQTGKKIAASALPPAVRKAAAAQSKGATVLGYSKETAKGRTYYELEMKRNGLSENILMDSTGAVTEIEKEVPTDSLASAVREGLQKAAGEGKIVKVESLTKHGTLVAYEAQVRKGSKTSEVQVGPDGGTLAHEE